MYLVKVLQRLIMYETKTGNYNFAIISEILSQAHGTYGQWYTWFLKITYLHWLTIYVNCILLCLSLSIS